MASPDLTAGKMIFEWLGFFVEVKSEKNRKSTAKSRKMPKKSKNTEKKPKSAANFKFGTVFFVFFSLFCCNPLYFEEAIYLFLY